MPVGTVLGWIGAPGETPGEADAAPAASAAGATGKVRAAPAVRSLAKEHGIDLQALAGSGPDGRIVRADVEAAITARDGSVGPGEDDGAERIALKGVRRIMADRMAQSASTAAAVTTVVDVDMGAIHELKKTREITVTSAVVKATAAALQQYRILNAALEGDEILLHKRVHIGVAVAGKHGLNVLCIAGADRKALSEIDAELGDLAGQARDGSLKVERMEAPTFTVTNSGVFGSLIFTPIINPPQSAILGVGKVQVTPVARDGAVVIRPVMYLCLTYDHRIVEGAEAVGALQVIKARLEDPAWMT